LPISAKQDPGDQPGWYENAVFGTILGKSLVFAVPNLFLKVLSVFRSKILLVIRKFVRWKYRIRRTSRDASSAIQALVGVNVQLSCPGEGGFVFGGVNTVVRTSIHTQRELSAAINDYMSHCGVSLGLSSQRALRASRTKITIGTTAAHKPNFQPEAIGLLCYASKSV
jgi:hypothetical protein